jgi:hypothetical protein
MPKSVKGMTLLSLSSSSPQEAKAEPESKAAQTLHPTSGARIGRKEYEKEYKRKRKNETEWKALFRLSRTDSSDLELP